MHSKKSDKTNKNSRNLQLDGEIEVLGLTALLERKVKND